MKHSRQMMTLFQWLERIEPLRFLLEVLAEDYGITKGIVSDLITDLVCLVEPGRRYILSCIVASRGGLRRVAITGFLWNYFSHD